MKTKIVIELVVECDAPGVVEDAVDRLLDAGSIQDTIAEYVDDHHSESVEFEDSRCHTEAVQ